MLCRQSPVLLVLWALKTGSCSVGSHQSCLYCGLCRQGHALSAVTSLTCTVGFVDRVICSVGSHQSYLYFGLCRQGHMLCWQSPCSLTCTVGFVDRVICSVGSHQSYLYCGLCRQGHALSAVTSLTCTVGFVDRVMLCWQSPVLLVLWAL